MAKVSSAFGQKLSSNLPSLTLLLVGFIVGVLWFGALRFMLAEKPEATHYHANFALYVDGKRETFNNFAYYEEVVSCSEDESNNPRTRVHMHGQVNDVIHVHDKRVTYADFFNNLDWTLGPDFIRTNKKLIANTEQKRWVFMLNGEKVGRVDNRIIENEDELLITYGSDDAAITQQAASIENKAAAANKSVDPASCGSLGDTGNGFLSRLKHAFSFTH